MPVSPLFAYAVFFRLSYHSLSALQGLLDLQEGDAVFARDVTSAGDPSEDLLKILICTLCVTPYLHMLFTRTHVSVETKTKLFFESGHLWPLLVTPFWARGKHVMVGVYGLRNGY